MKIGINNIYTCLILFFFVFAGVEISYTIITEPSGHLPTPLYPFLFIIIGISIAVFISILYNFRFLVIDDMGIYCFYPFLLRKRAIKWVDLKNVKTEAFIVWYTDGREVILNSDTTTISFSSLEFENFDTLIKQIPNGQNILKEITLKFYAFIEIKYDFIEQIVYIGLLIFSLYFVCSNYTWISNIVIPLAILLLYSSIKRLVRLVRAFKMLKSEKDCN